MHNWVIWSVPLYFVLTSRLTRRANAIALWIYLWCLAGCVAAATWRGYIAWQHIASWLPHDHGPAKMLWIGVIVTVMLIILPVVWYRCDLRNERRKADAGQAA